MTFRPIVESCMLFRRSNIMLILGPVTKLTLVDSFHLGRSSRLVCAGEICSMLHPVRLLRVGQRVLICNGEFQQEMHISYREGFLLLLGTGYRSSCGHGMDI